MQPALDLRPGLRRRQLLVGSAWSVPVISMMSSAPAVAASVTPYVTATESGGREATLTFHNLTGATQIRIDSITYVSGQNTGTFTGPFPTYAAVTNGLATAIDMKNNNNWQGTTWQVTYYLLVNNVWVGPYTLNFVL